LPDELNKALQQARSAREAGEERRQLLLTQQEEGDRRERVVEDLRDAVNALESARLKACYGGDASAFDPDEYLSAVTASCANACQMLKQSGLTAVWGDDDTEEDGGAQGVAKALISLALAGRLTEGALAKAWEVQPRAVGKWLSRLVEELAGEHEAEADPREESAQGAACEWQWKKDAFWFRGERYPLTGTPLKLLKAFTGAPEDGGGHILTHEQINKACNGGYTTRASAYVSELNKALMQLWGLPTKPITSIYGKEAYRFTPPR
jgi:hypothetical protein